MNTILLPKISMIAAIGARTRALGHNNDLLWHLSDDLKRFKKITLRHSIIMGSNTFESIGRPLPNRKNIVLSHDPAYKAEGVFVVHSIEDALRFGSKEPTDEIFIIGGGQVFKAMLAQTDKLYLTLVDDDAKGDVYFPPYGMFTKKVFEEKHLDSNPPYTYVELER